MASKRGIEYQHLIELERILAERFNEEELPTLCYLHLDVDYERLRGEGKAVKARELINYTSRLKIPVEKSKIGC